MKCQDCGGPVCGDNLICDKCRYTEEDAVDMMKERSPSMWGCLTLLILLFVLGGWMNRRPPIKPYYYFWTCNYQGGNGWGENTICLDHKPTKKEVVAVVKTMIGKNSKCYLHINVEYIGEDNRHPFDCSPDSASKKPF